MRWDELFDDLEGQLEQELAAERADVLAEEERLRLGRLSLRDRLLAVAAGGEELVLVLRDGREARLRVASSGRDWIAGEMTGGGRVRRQCVIPLAAVASVLPRGTQLAESLGAEPPDQEGRGVELSLRLGLPFVLRDLARRRVAVDLTLPWGALHGTLDRIGRDHLDLAEHAAGEPRRSAAVRQTRLVPFSELLLVRF
jgi:hypothetical protein